MSWWRRDEASTVQVVGHHRGCVPLILRPYRDHAMLSRKEYNHQSEDLAAYLEIAGEWRVSSYNSCYTKDLA